MWLFNVNCKYCVALLQYLSVRSWVLISNSKLAKTESGNRCEMTEGRTHDRTDGRLLMPHAHSQQAHRFTSKAQGLRKNYRKKLDTRRMLLLRNSNCYMEAICQTCGTNNSNGNGNGNSNNNHCCQLRLIFSSRFISLFFVLIKKEIFNIIPQMKLLTFTDERRNSKTSSGKSWRSGSASGIAIAGRRNR